MPEVLIDVEATFYLIVTIMGILTPVGVIIGRAFWAKHKCFQQQTETLKAQAKRIEDLEKHDESSITDHDNYEERLGKIESEIQETKIYLGLLLDKAGIKHD